MATRRKALTIACAIAMVVAVIGFGMFIESGKDRLAERMGVERVDCNPIHDITCGPRSAWAWLKGVLDWARGASAQEHDRGWVLDVTIQILDFSDTRDEPVDTLQFRQYRRPPHDHVHWSEEGCVGAAVALGKMLEEAMASHISMANTPQELGLVALPHVACYSPSTQMYSVPKSGWE